MAEKARCLLTAAAAEAAVKKDRSGRPRNPWPPADAVAAAALLPARRDETTRHDIHCVCAAESPVRVLSSVHSTPPYGTGAPFRRALHFT